ncbi:MAG: hypothetical protein M3452_11610, partial [Chloroflexota bacterium]|nr:hypothetical protein [Chloroflexota bacterium]
MNGNPSHDRLDHDAPEQHNGGHQTSGPMKYEDHLGMIREMREKWLWTNGTVMMLGLWLITSPFTFNYTSAAMRWSDIG